MTLNAKNLKTAIKEAYGLAALHVEYGIGCGCETCLSGGNCDPIPAGIYEEEQISSVPEEAIRASLGCGNPTALAEIKPGDTVLGLGAGGGIDVFLADRMVGSTGKAYGLDMTDEMIALAREIQRKAGIENAEFLKGDIEDIPLPDNSVNVIISNCVISLSTDKDRVFAEAFRLLRPGGRLTLSDVVLRGKAPENLCYKIELWIGCVAGALEETDYREKLKKAGFIKIDIRPTRIYDIEDMTNFLNQYDIDLSNLHAKANNRFMSAFISAVKPSTT